MPSPMTGTAFHDFEHAGWRQAAGQYDAAFARLTGQAVAPLLAAVGVGPGTRLLDLAAGPGYAAAEAARRGAQALAIDFAAEMVELGRRRHPRIELRQGDVEELDLPDGGHDAAVMAFGLLHLARPDRALAEAYRVLRPGGRFAATVWAPPQRAIGFRLVLDAVRAHGRDQVGLPAGPPFFRFSDHAEFGRSLEAARFTAVAVREVALEWVLRDAGEFLAAMRFGTVRTGALLAAQTPAGLAAISADVTRACAAYAGPLGLHLPMPAVLAVGTRSA